MVLRWPGMLLNAEALATALCGACSVTLSSCACPGSGDGAILQNNCRLGRGPHGAAKETLLHFARAMLRCVAFLLLCLSISHSRTSTLTHTHTHTHTHLFLLLCLSLSHSRTSTHTHTHTHTHLSWLNVRDLCLARDQCAQGGRGGGGVSRAA